MVANTIFCSKEILNTFNIFNMFKIGDKKKKKREHVFFFFLAKNIVWISFHFWIVSHLMLILHLKNEKQFYIEMFES